MLIRSRRALGRHPIRVAAFACLALAAIGLGLYGTLRAWGNRHGPCGPAVETLARMAPLARGEVAAFEVASIPEPAPDLSFTDADGRTRHSADLRGQTWLLNLWATWCEPCRREMPALDALQAALGGPGFAVVAVNIDTRNLDRPRAWLESVGVTRLGYNADPSAAIFQDLRKAGLAEGMPTSILIDAAGCRLGRLSGPAEWASPDALALIRAATGRS